MNTQDNFNPFNNPIFEDQKEEAADDVVKAEPTKIDPDFNPFDSAAFEEPEGRIKSTLRSLIQAPLGLAQAATFFMDLIQMASFGDVFDEDEVDRIENIAKREGVPFDREQYYKNVGKAFESFPTVSNVSRMVEESTGVPLIPKTGLQQAINFGSTVTGLLPKAAGSLAQRAIIGSGVSGVEKILEAKGVPKAVAEPLSALAVGKAPSGKEAAKLIISKKTKPSGLTERRFEKSIKQQTPVSPKKLRNIDAKVEKEFRDLQEKIVDISSIKKTKDLLRENPTFKAESREIFKEVEKLAEDISGTFNSNLVRKDLTKRSAKTSDTSFGPSEYDKSYRSAIKQILKDSPIKPVKPAKAVAKYRSNNRELGEIYESGKSGGWNRGKKDALLDHNRSIAQVMESEYTKSEFAELFKKTNDQWTKINDVEAINKFTDSLFKGEIKFERGEKWLRNQGMREPFRRALGEKGSKQYEQLLNDLMTTERARGLMIKAKSQGLGGYFKHHLLWKLSPFLGKATIAVKSGKMLYRKIWQAMLDKPILSIQYRKGVSAAKAGDFKVANKIFKELETKVLGKEASADLTAAENKAIKDESNS